MDQKAAKVPIGRRLNSSNIICQANGQPVHIADRLASDGRFRVLIFPGDVVEYPENLKTLHKFQDSWTQSISLPKIYPRQCICQLSY